MQLHMQNDLLKSCILHILFTISKTIITNIVPPVILTQNACLAFLLLLFYRMQIPSTDLNLLVLKNALASDICVEMRIIGPRVWGIRGDECGSP